MEHILPLMMMLAHGALLLAQAPQRACCEMTIVPAQERPAEVVITIKNIGARSLSFGETFAEADFKVRVVSGDGREPHRTEFGKRLLTPQVGAGRNLLVELSVGEICTERYSVDSVFELKPGPYRVWLMRDVSADGKAVQLATSVQITIPEKQQPAGRADR
jgi:hypothetical protein